MMEASPTVLEKPYIGPSPYAISNISTAISGPRPDGYMGRSL